MKKARICQLLDHDYDHVHAIRDDLGFKRCLRCGRVIQYVPNVLGLIVMTLRALGRYRWKDLMDDRA